jgi:hypothetical protein
MRLGVGGVLLQSPLPVLTHKLPYKQMLIGMGQASWHSPSPPPTIHPASRCCGGGGGGGGVPIISPPYHNSTHHACEMVQQQLVWARHHQCKRTGAKRTLMMTPSQIGKKKFLFFFKNKLTI